MKKQFLCTAVLGLLLAAGLEFLPFPSQTGCRGAAFGKVREFKYFSLDVPKGWKVARKDASVRVRKADKSASIIITIDSMGGRSLKDIAEEASRKYSGNPPEIDEDGDYSFSANDDSTQVFVSEVGDYYLMLSVTGTDETADELAAILDSLEMKGAEDFGGGDDDGGNDD
nr:hypothetical protein [Fretibacterium sp.]